MYLTKVAILTTYSKLLQRYEKNYVYPTQDSILALLKRYHNISISRRTLAYHMADLRIQGHIKTIRRSHRTTDGHIHQLSTAVCLTIRGCQLLWKLGSGYALRQLKKLRSKFGLDFTKTQPSEQPTPKKTVKTPGALNKATEEAAYIRKERWAIDYLKRKGLYNPSLNNP